MLFIETRGNDGKKPQKVPFSEAILSPSASFGGLYVPESLPNLDETFFQNHLKSSYKALAYDLLKRFEIDIEDDLIQEALDLYDKFDDPNNPVPVVEVEEKFYVSELYHGPTRAFKDMALQPFGYILSSLAKQRGENYLILAATSGDTGPATLETFKNKPNIKVACLYPAGGTSDVQRLQMVTEDGKNLKVIGIEGNFDDAQTALKNLLASSEFKSFLQSKGIKLSAANSVNFGRIIFQIIYHIHSYLELMRKRKIDFGHAINLIVPSGNFGNALGAYYAKKMGLPVAKILIASNANNVLTQLIREGRYDLRDKCLIQTSSPAMDILKSSNVERVLFDKFGPERTKELMESLNEKNYYELTKEELQALQEDFDADFTTDDEVMEVIKKYVTQKSYLMDPHTATTVKLYKTHKEKENIAYSTAEWTKFAPTVYKALTGKDEKVRDQEALEAVSQMTGAKIPERIKSLFEKPIIHDTVIPKEKIQETIIKFLE
ncbi:MULTISPECIES: threonine synthase [unclassified Nitratiruptor]|uniref:threonine synthase n=1 Tax=unclassified Nitratiruptor TaxID=2624044 RepID=UPI0019161226|nr:MULTISPECIES: threonine synthase [unclassified Nitratiruptor]BCD60244.1 threonine synthase [Nitratiruptor sp. YY08-10]BCD64267.1 threonine synthase [Nitratiruptor sp. YY08-14]